MNRPKVAFVNQAWNPAIPPVTAGSIAIWVFEVARRLTADCDVTVFSRLVDGEPPDRHVDGVRYLRCSNWPTPFGGLGRMLLRASSGWDEAPDVAMNGYFSAYHRRVARAIAVLRPDIVHVQNLGQAACAVRRACPGARTVLHMHCEWLSQLPRSLIEEWITSSDLVLGCSRYITSKIKEAWPAHAGRCATLYNAVDTTAFSPAGRARRFGDHDDEIVLFVGRLTPEKGLHWLIRCFDEVLRRRPRARLVIAGPESVTPREYLVGISNDDSVQGLGEFYADGYVNLLKRMISANAQERVHFIGSMPHDALPEVYRGADVLVNPSLSESFGMTVLEAMACGLPAVVTAAGGMPEVVDEGRLGVIVEPAKAEPLANAIVELLEDRERRKFLGVAAAAHVQANFTWQQIAADARALYRTCGASRSLL